MAHRVRQICDSCGMGFFVSVEFQRVDLSIFSEHFYITLAALSAEVPVQIRLLLLFCVQLTMFVVAL